MEYTKMTKEHFEYISNIVGANNIKVANEIEEDFAHDELVQITAYPEAHVTVNNKEEIVAIMKYATLKHIPVVVRGSGTGLVGACVAIYGGILLDMTKMNKIIELDEINMTLTVEPGVLLMDISTYVEERGFFYAPDPGEKSATIGGNIATNAGGMRAVKYGVTRDWVRGLEIILPNGEIIQAGTKVVKNSTGFSIKDLMIGSEGTLGIISEAILKLIPLPPRSVSLLVPFKDYNAAIEAVPKVMMTKALPTALEFVDKHSLKFSEEFLGKKIPNNDYDAYLLLSYDGTDEIIKGDVEMVSELCVSELGALDVYLIDTDERKDSVWDARGAFLEAIKASTTLIDECDVVLPRSHVSEFLTFTTKVSKELDIRIPYFGHAGDGNLHIYFCKDDLTDDVWEEKLKQGFKRMYDKAFEFGGLVSGEHGIGFAKKEYMLQLLGKTQIDIMKGIKKVFDPSNILNPGKVI